jgi:N-acetylglucosamine kinase-like BadF-type ATPase
MFRCGGWGPHLGDEGGGYWIGREAIRTALELIEAGADSGFHAYLASRLELGAGETLVDAFSSGRLGVGRVATLAEAVVERLPEERSARIVRDAAGHLARLVDRARRKLDVETPRIAAVGSIGTLPVIRHLIGVPFAPAISTPEWGAIYWARQSRNGAEGST